MSARANCRLEGIQFFVLFFFFKWLLSFWLAWFSPVTHAPFHRVETASMQTVSAYSQTRATKTHTCGHMNTLDRQNCTATTHTTKTGQTAWMKD